MSRSFKNIIPCSGWFFEETDTGIAFPVAVWAQLENGEVIGLISVNMKEAVTSDNVARLVTPPPVGGHYVLEKDLGRVFQKDGTPS